MKKGIILLTIILLSFSSCMFFESYDYGAGYTVGEDPEYASDIVIDRADTSFYFDYGDGKKYLRHGVLVKYHRPGGKVDSFLIWKGTPVICSYINQVSFDSTFILVDQKPLDSIWGKYFIDNNGVYRRSNEPERYDLAEEKLEKSKIHCYYIIDKRTDDIYGPYNWVQFLEEQKKLGVSESLKLEKE